MFKHLKNAQLILYSDAGHGALFQYPERFVRKRSSGCTFNAAQGFANVLPLNRAGLDICRTLGFWLILSRRRLVGLKCLPGLVGAELGLENRRARLSLR